MKNFTLFLFTVLTSALGFGQTAYQTNTTPATWSTTTHFTPNGSPGAHAGDDITIAGNNAVSELTADGTNNIDQLTLTTAGGLFAGGQLNIGDDGGDSFVANTIISGNGPATFDLNVLDLRFGSITVNTGITINSGQGLTVNYGYGNPVTWHVNSSSFTLPGTLSFNDNASGGEFVYSIDVSATYSSQFSTHNFNSVDVKSGTTLELDADLTNTNLTGTITIEDGASLNLNEQDVSGLDDGDIAVEAGAKVIIPDNTTFPSTDIEGTSNATPALNSEFDYTSTASQSISNATGANQVIGNLRVSGGGTLTIGSAIGTGNNEFDIKNIYIDSGTVILDAACTLLASGGLQVGEHGTLQINESGSFEIGDLVLNEGSTIIYNKSSTHVLTSLSNVYNLQLSTSGGAITYSNDNGALTIHESLTFGTDNVTFLLKNNLIIESDAQGSAYIGEMQSNTSIDDVGAGGTGTGSVIVKKFFNLPDGGFRDYSSPIPTATIADLNFVTTGIDGSNYPGSSYPSIDTNLYFYDESTDANEDLGFGPWYYPSNISNTVNHNNVVRIYDGYGTRNNSTASVTGAINQGDVSFSITKSDLHAAPEYNGWNLIGNPYPADLDGSAIASRLAAAANLSGNIYILSPSEDGGYCTITSGGGDCGLLNSDIIPSFQGFWVSNTGSASEAFSLVEGDKLNSNSVNYKSQTKDFEFMYVNLHEDDELTDKFRMYFHKNGSNLYNSNYDGPKMNIGTSSTDSYKSYIDIFDGKKNLNLGLKVLPTNSLSINQTFKVHTNSSSNQNLSLKNIDNFNQYYNCFYLVYDNTGEHINIDAEEVNIDLLDGISEHQFTLVAKNDANYLDINKVDATCFGNEDGLLNIKGHDLPQNYYVNIYKDGELFDSFNGENGTYKKSVAAGEYTMKVNGISNSCTYNYVTTIESNPEIISNFEVASDIETGVAVEFTAKSENATDYEWTLTNTGETFFGESFTKTFENPGIQWLKLRSIGENQNCFDEINKEFYVAQGSVNITESEFFDSIDIKAINNNVKITGLKSGDFVTLHTLDGKLINSSKVSSQEINLNTNGNSTVIVSIESGENKYSKKINL